MQTPLKALKLTPMHNINPCSVLSAMRACDHAGRPAGVGLVTNTELSSPYDGLNALESTVFGRFEAFFDVKKNGPNIGCLSQSV